MQRRQRFVLVSFLLALTAAGGGLAVWNLPARAAAQESAKGPRALLQVTRQPPKLLSAAVENARDYERYQKTQAALIKSQLVLSIALRSNEVPQLPAIKSRTDPVAWLQQNLDVTILPDTELLQVSMAAGSGASIKDQSALINAVVRAYMDDLVEVDSKRRMERYKTLKKIKERYASVLNDRRNRLRKLSEIVGRDEPTKSLSEIVGRGEPIKSVEKHALPRLYHDLRTQRVKLRLERAEAETLLARRKKAEGTATDPVRKELAQLEDRLAVVTSQEKVLDEELLRLTHEPRRGDTQTVSNTLDLAALKEEIAHIEAASRQVSKEVETLTVELGAPPRVRLIDRAVPPSP